METTIIQCESVTSFYLFWVAARDAKHRTNMKQDYPKRLLGFIDHDTGSWFTLTMSCAMTELNNKELWAKNAPEVSQNEWKPFRDSMVTRAGREALFGSEVDRPPEKEDRSPVRETPEEAQPE